MSSWSQWSSCGVAAALLAIGVLPQAAQAQSLPPKIGLETCWYGVCSGTYVEYHFVTPNPILAADSGEIWNSQGFAGYYTFDPFSKSLQLVTINFPVGIYDGQYIDGCLSGTVNQVTYNGWGNFFWEGCP